VLVIGVVRKMITRDKKMAPQPAQGNGATFTLLGSFCGALDFLAAAFDVFAGAFDRVARREQEGGRGASQCNSFAYHDGSFHGKIIGCNARESKQLSCQRLPAVNSPIATVARRPAR
jgi:hypothetical protein